MKEKGKYLPEKPKIIVVIKFFFLKVSKNYEICKKTKKLRAINKKKISN